MQSIGQTLFLSASDLIGHLGCRHLTELDRAVASGMLEKPRVWDPLLQILQERGFRHENGFVEHLAAGGIPITVIDGEWVTDDSVADTRAAMVRGDAVIVQGAFRSERWVGRTDVLRRIEVPSRLGGWSYEVIDTKLSKETKAGTVLQLCLYADLIADVQGTRPEHCHVVVPGCDYEPESYRIDDYAAYYRRARRSLETALCIEADSTLYPDPKPHCDVCRWQERCDQQRRKDDHLCLVAGISKMQITELKGHGIDTLAHLAVMPLPMPWRPERGVVQSYERVREQARIQLEGRTAGRLVHEILPVVPGSGLALLPEPSAGDLFFDLEGDPFAAEGGLEYLFGYACTDGKGGETCTSDWALSPEQEKHAFERFVDFVMVRLQQYPDLHIYHYAPYEPAALKRLMGRYATREAEIDTLLRGDRFVDLYGVVRNAMRASVESYSIKKLEPLYGFTRAVPLPDANRSLTRLQSALELGESDGITAADRATVAGYNRDDCISTWRLRNWLEVRRAELVAQGTVIPRPIPEDGKASEEVTERQARVARLVERLAADVPVAISERSPDQHARWLLANLLDWHRREAKAVWWEYFRLRELGEEDLLEERAGLAGLEFLGERPGTRGSVIHRYRFPVQETEIRDGDPLHAGEDKFGTVEAISVAERWIDVRRRSDDARSHPYAIFTHDNYRTESIADALMRIGEGVADHGMASDGPYQPARDLLMRAPPRLVAGQVQNEGESPFDAAIRIGPMLGSGVLPIQGPPGAGKTYTGARMICALVKAGKTVGVTANSHKVIRNLLDAVLEAATATGTPVRCMQKVSEIEPDVPGLRFTKKNPELLNAISDDVDVAGGTAWLWSSEPAAQSVDVLFIDEAAQMSLANVLAVSQAARSLVLLGDPQQLEQPMQGSHPEGTDVSALHHLLAGHQTILPGQGLFLAETWRLHPDICAFTSEVFYEGRLQPRRNLDRQAIRSSGRIRGNGLRYVPIPTQGNQSSSPEEADRIRDLVAEIFATDTHWIDKDGIERRVGLDDILVIAPYNAQVFELKSRLPDARIGTVDKFQGQEAPIVLYSMTTSSWADAPRGMEFLYSLNRLNVATSRAMCLCILIASPTVFEAECRTPRQMQLANAFCRYLELASPL